MAISTQTIAPLLGANENSPIQKKREILHNLGFSLFPLANNSKGKPVKDKWQYRKETEYTFVESNNMAVKLNEFQPPNIKRQLATEYQTEEELNTQFALFVLDVDNKDNRDGIAHFRNLRSQLGLPKTYTVKTPSDGFHYYYYTTLDLLKTLFPTVPKHPSPNHKGIDIRTYKNYVVSPFSKIAKKDPRDPSKSIFKPYEIVSPPNTPISKAPIELLQYCLAQNQSNTNQSNTNQSNTNQYNTNQSNSQNLPSDTSNPFLHLAEPTDNPAAVAEGAVVDTPDNIIGAERYIRSLEITRSGNRDNTAFIIACKLKEMFALSQRQCEQTLFIWSQERCHPTFSKDRTNIKVKSAYTTARNKIGSDSAEHTLHVMNAERAIAPLDHSTYAGSIISISPITELPIIERQPLASLTRITRKTNYRAQSIEQMQQCVFSILSNGKHNLVISKITKEPRAHNFKLTPHLYSDSEVAKDYASIHTQRLPVEYSNKNSPKTIPLAEAMKLRGKYISLDTISFRPDLAQIDDGNYNLYQGANFVQHTKEEEDLFNDEEKALRKEVKEKLLTNYFLEILANNDEDKYKFIMSWVAKLVQEPMWKPATALAFNGSQGTGKSFLSEMILSTLFGADQIVQYSSIDQLKSNFNALQANARLVNLEECVNPDNPKEAGFMKQYLSGTRKIIEEKFKDAIATPKYSGTIFTSNHDHFIYAEKNERRYFVAKVSDIRKQDVVFFRGLLSLLDDEGTNNGWKHLYSILSDPRLITVDPDIALETEELSFQIKAHIERGDPRLAFLLHCIQNNIRFDADPNAKFITSEFDNYAEKSSEPKTGPDDHIKYYNFEKEHKTKPHEILTKLLKEHYYQFLEDNYTKKFIEYNKTSASALNKYFEEHPGGIVQGKRRRTADNKPYAHWCSERGIRSPVIICPSLQSITERIKGQLKLDEKDELPEI